MHHVGGKPANVEGRTLGKVLTLSEKGKDRGKQDTSEPKCRSYRN